QSPCWALTVPPSGAWAAADAAGNIKAAAKASAASRRADRGSRKPRRANGVRRNVPFPASALRRRTWSPSSAAVGEVSAEKPGDPSPAHREPVVRWPCQRAALLAGRARLGSAIAGPPSHSQIRPNCATQERQPCSKDKLAYPPAAKAKGLTRFANFTAWICRSGLPLSPHSSSCLVQLRAVPCVRGCGLGLRGAGHRCQERAAGVKSAPGAGQERAKSRLGPSPSWGQRKSC